MSEKIIKLTVGGDVQASNGTYLPRSADNQLLEACMANEFAYVLATRQIGKSSLKNAIAKTLELKGRRVARIELNSIGKCEPENWYFTFMYQMAEDLKLVTDVNAWWEEQPQKLTNNDRLLRFLRHVVMKEISEAVVVFIDEIDFTLNLSFKDDFFAAIRVVHNERSKYAEFQRLSFVLLGVATPDDLINDYKRTPFNIGIPIGISDFSWEECFDLQQAIKVTHTENSKSCFKQIYGWTRGHPYLTQKLCSAVVKCLPTDGSVSIDKLVEEIFFPQGERSESNISFVQSRVLNDPYKQEMLSIYKQVLKGIRTPDDKKSFAVNKLKLYGLIIARNGFLEVRNPIYHKIFDLDWIQSNMPIKYHIGGCLGPDSPSYVKRASDDTLLSSVLAGKFCYIHSLVQMGKSSLMIHTSQRLHAHKVHTVMIDTGAIGIPKDAHQWYYTLLDIITSELNLSVNLHEWWLEKINQLSSESCFIKFLRDVVLVEYNEKIVFFLDDIGFLISYDFTKDFFAIIRSIYDERAIEPSFKRLSFVIMSLYLPSELVEKHENNLFSISQEIELEDFSRTEAAILENGLEEICHDQCRTIFDRIYDWTDGHPYLTQKLCQAVINSDDKQTMNHDKVDQIVERLFLSKEKFNESNFNYILKRLLIFPYYRRALRLYRDIYEGKLIENDENSTPQEQLKILGLVKVEKGNLRIRNKIYRKVFDLDWINDNITVPTDSPEVKVKDRKSDRVFSTNFVGREKELSQFIEVVNSESKVHILNVYGSGGVGKTTLLFHMQSLCENFSHIISFKEMIDFYHSENHYKIGLMKQLINIIGIERFPQFETISQNESITNIESAFFQEYFLFSEKIGREGKKIVLFFDEYEKIQSSNFSKLLETAFFPKLNNNTILVVSGRYPYNEWFKDTFQIEVDPFTLNDTINFLKIYLDKKTTDELSERIGSYKTIEIIHQLSEGRPILLCLFIDWINNEDNPLYPEELITAIQSKTEIFTTNITLEQKRLFEKILIDRIAHLKEPEDITITYLAFAFHRMTPDMFSFLTDIPIDESKEILLNNLKSLSFIKYKKPDIILLHDEFRDLIVRHWWEQQDASGILRKEIAKKLSSYYEEFLKKESISQSEKAILSAEQLYYILYSDIEKGLDIFITEFDNYLSQYKIHFCELLLQEIFRNEFYSMLSYEGKLKVDIRQIRWYNEQYRSHEALELADRIIEYTDVNEIDKLLFASLKHERGLANIWLNHFDEAIHDFVTAEKAYRKAKDQYHLAWELTWLGFAQYLKGEYVEAEKIFINSTEEFIRFREKIPEELYLRIAYNYHNLNAALRCQGRFYEAINYGEIAVTVVKESQSDHDLTRFLIELGDTYTIANKTFEASKAYKQASELLNKVQDQDPLLKARCQSGLGYLSCRLNEFNSLQYYQMNNGNEEKKSLKYNDDLQFGYNSLLQAKTILEEHINNPTRELADTYFKLAEYYSLRSDWNYAIKYYKQSEKIAKLVRYEYREMDAILGQMTAYYYGSRSEFIHDADLHIEESVKRFYKSEHHSYPDLSGKMKIIQGNIACDRYCVTRNENELKLYVQHYIQACDHMYHFNLDRFHMALRMLLKRINELDVNTLSPKLIDSLREIWYYDKKNIKVSQIYRNQFDEIVDFALRKMQINENNQQELETYTDILKNKLFQCIDEKRENLSFAPFYGEMLLYYQICAGLNQDIAEAYYILGNSYTLNDDIFEAKTNYELALEKIRKTDDSLLTAKILIGLGAVLYGRQEYAKTIEHYRKMDIMMNVEIFKRENMKEIEQATNCFVEADNILEQFDLIDIESNKNLAWIQADLECRWAELVVITSGHSGDMETELRLRNAIAKADFSGNIKQQIDALESLITYYYFSEQWEHRRSEIHQIQNKIELLVNQQHSPISMARLKTTLGDVYYDQIVVSPDDISLIEKAFTYYIQATQDKAYYSEKHFFESIGNLLLRIAHLPKESVRILYHDIYYRRSLHQKRPTGAAAEKAYQLVEQFLYIRSQIL